MFPTAADMNTNSNFVFEEFHDILLLSIIMQYVPNFSTKKLNVQRSNFLSSIKLYVNLSSIVLCNKISDK